jgi:conjugative transfer pilus assembly protein TraH
MSQKPSLKIKFKRKIAAIFLLVAFTNSFADIDSDLNTFFSKLGYDSNYTSPSAYEGQAAGYYSGGGVVMRSRVRNIELMHIDLPSIRAGCGGIDLFLGGFSFINADKMIEFLRSIMNNATGYAMNLALETMAPQIAHTLKWAQKVAQDINSMNMNSCEMAEGLVGGMWPRAQAAKNLVCKNSGGAKKNIFSDWAEARYKCGKGEQGYEDSMKKAEEDPEYKKSILRNKNLIWKALENKKFLMADGDLRELFMSISGTMVFDQDSKAHIFAPLAKDKDILKAMLIGGSANSYLCDSKIDCLNPTIGTIKISDKNALYNKVRQAIYDIYDTLRDKNKDKDGLSPQSKGFLEMTRLPILEFIKVHLTSGDAIAATSIADYSEAIAKTILKEYLTEALDITEHSLSGTDYPSETNKQLIDQMHQARIYIDSIRSDSRKDIQELMIHIENTKGAERETASKVSGQLKNILGGNQ